MPNQSLLDSAKTRVIITQMKNILIVEDDADIRDLIEMTLELTTGHHIISACDGDEAWLKINNVGIDLVVTDFRMPKMKGPNFGRLKRSKGPR